MTGPLSCGLIPPALASHGVTTADLAARSSFYSAAIAQSLVDFSAPPLTAAQTAAINAQLAYLAPAGFPGAVGSPSYTYSTCP